MRFRSTSSGPPGLIIVTMGLLLMMAMTAVAAPLPQINVDYPGTEPGVVNQAVDSAANNPLLANAGVPQQDNPQEVGLVPRPAAVLVATLTAANNTTTGWRDFTQAECGLVNNAAAAAVANMPNMRPSNSANNIVANWCNDWKGETCVAQTASRANTDVTSRNTPLLC